MAAPGALVQQTIDQLREQAEWCRLMGSRLYAALLDRAAVDVEEQGVTWRILEPYTVPGRRGAALALRLMAAVHRIVLTGAAPALAGYYPSVGGRDESDAWPAFHDVLAGQEESVRACVARPCQTNEVGRCAALIVGFLAAAEATRLPLRILEVGASAGLSLRWDHFHYGDRTSHWGDPRSPVDLEGLWDEAPPHLHAPIHVVSRRGCDLSPLDPTREEHRLALQASVWADQVLRFQRLRGALELAGRVPATVDQASIMEWLPERLHQPSEGTTTLVYHSIVEEYVSQDELAAFHRTMAEVGARASPRTPLGWVRLEPEPGQKRHQLTLNLWPGGQERRLAVSGAHGTNVRAFMA